MEQNLNCCYTGVPISEIDAFLIRWFFYNIKKEHIQKGTLVEVLDKSESNCKNLHSIEINNKRFYFCDNQAIAARAKNYNGGCSISSEIIELKEQLKGFFNKKFNFDIDRIINFKEEKCCDIDYIIGEEEEALVRGVLDKIHSIGKIDRLPAKGKLCKIKKRAKSCDNCFIIKEGVDEYCDNPVVRIKFLLANGNKKEERVLIF